MPYRDPVEWPDGARLVVTTSVMFEEGGQIFPVRSATPYGPLPADYRDFVNESWYEYGVNVAIPRILDIFDRHGVKSSFFVVGRACERNPGLVKEIAQRGHEVAGHGWEHRPQYSMEREEEREFIRKTVGILQRTVGEPPRGWNCGSPRDSVNTLELLKEQGFTYHIDDVADDVPFFRDVNGEKFVVVPYVPHLNDLRTISPGYTAPQWLEGYKFEFDWLYAEGHMRPTMMCITCHPRVGGRAWMAKVLNEFISYALKHPGVTFMRKRDIADWWYKRYGNEKPAKPFLMDT
jgi:peptidoglycan/xylan/chitin deacetylase (PgdA/CDA1 family)